MYFVSGKELTNGHKTFILLPDGSKEAWETSDRVDNLRERFISYIKSLECDCTDWVSVSFGELGQRVEDGNNHEPDFF